MSMSVSLKKSTTKTNIDHNNRTMSDKEKERNSHIDYERSDENKYLIQEDIRDLYKREFGEALENYNAKQRRSDRKIKDYYKHIEASKKTSTQQEMIIQIGDKDDFSNNENREIVNTILEEWFHDFEKRNPNLKVYNAVIHNDEASPHMHLNFVPVASGYKRGLEKQVAFDRAIIQQDSTLNKTRPFEDWREKEVQLLEQKLLERGIERKIVGTNKYKDVNEYKEKKDLEREIKQLEHDLSEKKNELLAFSEEIPIEIETKARRQMKNVEVPTGEKTIFGKEKTRTEKKPTKNVIVSETDYKKLVSAARDNEKNTSENETKARRQMKNVEVPTGEKTIFGKEKTRTEKKPTKNVIVSETDYKKLVSAARDNEKMKGHLRNLLNTDLAQENKKLKYENKVAYDDLSKFKAENRILKKESRELSWHIDDLKDHISILKQDIGLIYESAKEFLRERTDSLKAFKNVFKGFVDKVKYKTTQFEHKHDLGAKMNEFEKVHKQELRKERNRGLER